MAKMMDIYKGDGTCSLAFTGLDGDFYKQSKDKETKSINPSSDLCFRTIKKNEQTPRRTKDKDITMIISGIMEALCSVFCPLLTSSGKDTHL